jgi:ComEC/Rec2-related protein
MSKRYLFLSLILLILLHKLHKSNLLHNDRVENGLNGGIKFFYQIIDFSRNCTYKTPEFSFLLNQCKEYQLGSVIRVIGSLTPPSDKRFFSTKRLNVTAVEVLEFGKDSVNYWLEQLIRAILLGKQTLLEELYQNVPEPAAGLVSGMVFGGSQGLSEELEDNFRTTGLTHVVSASGYNVSLMVSLGLMALARTSRFLKMLGGIILVFIYALAALTVPPVLRASLMVGLSLVARFGLCRQYHAGYSLFLVILFLIWCDPWYARSLSLWLSVGATAGIIVFLPILQRSQGWFYRLSTGEVGDMPSNGAWYTIFLESFQTTVAAQIFTAPLMLATFGEFSWLSLVTNTLLLWITPLITLGGLAYMIIGVLTHLWEPLHTVVIQLITPPLVLVVNVFLSAIRWFGQFEAGVVRI